jgi:hypothetical protein
LRYLSQYQSLGHSEWMCDIIQYVKVQIYYLKSS